MANKALSFSLLSDHRQILPLGSKLSLHCHSLQFRSRHSVTRHAHGYSYHVVYMFAVLPLLFPQLPLSLQSAVFEIVFPYFAYLRSV